MKLYKHQERFIKKNPDRALLVWETGTGKTIAACEWAKKRPGKKVLVICPKAIVEKWERDFIENKVRNADVVSMSQLNKVDWDTYNALIIDEAQHFASPLFVRGRSLRTTLVYEYLKSHRDTHVLLLSATPVRSTPWNVHTLACYIGRWWELKEYRERFFYMTDTFGRWHWEPKKEWRKDVRPYVEEIADIVLMSDCVDVPRQHEQVIQIPWTGTDELALGNEYREPSAEWHARHKAEQGRKKYEALEKIIEGYQKMIVVCHYREQIDNYVAWIGDDREVFVLDGRTKNQDEVIEAAKKSKDCVFIVQASMGSGFDASEFSVVIFASMSFRYVDKVQMMGRVKRINNLHENMFYYLLAGKCDKAVYETIQKGKDFDVLYHI